jgi:hypothetical protein
MRQKRERHEKVVDTYKSKECCEESVSLFQRNIYSIENNAFSKDGDINMEESDENTDDDGDNQNENDKKRFKNDVLFNNQELEIKISNNNDSSDNNKSNQDRLTKKQMRQKKINEIIDKEHFIPYRPKNYQTEKG